MRRKRQLFLPVLFLCIAALAVVSLAGCSRSSELTREEAQRLLRKAGRYPITYDLSIMTGHRALKVTNETYSSFYPPPTTAPETEYDEQEFYDEAEQLRLVTVKRYAKRTKVKKISYFPYPWEVEFTYYQDVEMTAKGKSVFRQDAKDPNKWQVAEAKYDIEVTGVSMEPGERTAVVEYRIAPQILVRNEIAGLRPLRGISSKGEIDWDEIETERARFRLFDEGWRVEDPILDK